MTKKECVKFERLIFPGASAIVLVIQLPERNTTIRKYILSAEEVMLGDHQAKDKEF